MGCGAAAPPSAFGRAAASPQTRQMRCWPPPTEVIKAPVKGNLCAYWEQHPSRKNLPFTAEKQDVSSAGFQGNFLPLHSAIPTFLRGGITPSAYASCCRNAGRAGGNGGLIAPCRVLSPRRLCERTQRLTRANTGQFHPLRDSVTAVTANLLLGLSHFYRHCRHYRHPQGREEYFASPASAQFQGGCRVRSAQRNNG